jgi:hypothetical protein
MQSPTRVAPDLDPGSRSDKKPQLVVSPSDEIQAASAGFLRLRRPGSRSGATRLRRLKRASS